MALSLAAKLGPRGLQAFSLHPGVYASNLGRGQDWENEAAASLRKGYPHGRLATWVDVLTY
jgi:hypothetical protein